MKNLKKSLLRYVVIPIMVAIEVISVSDLYPICKDSFLRLLLLYFGVYATYDAYRVIKNYTEY